jgi:PAS domain S-box-containing protein
MGGKDMTEAPDAVSPAEWEAELRKLARMAPASLPIPSLEEAMSAPPGSIAGLAEPRTTLPEAQYRTLVEQLPAVTFMASFQHGLREVYVSPQIQDLLGYTQAEWLESPKLWLDSLHPGDLERWHADFAPLVFEGKPFHGVYRFHARDGRVVWILSDARIVRDDAGQPLFVQGVGFDISELKRTEEALLQRTGELEVANREVREAQRSLQEIASTIRETFWVVGPTLDRILYASPAFRTIWGRPPEELDGPLPAALLHLVHPQDRDRVARALERTRSEETEIEHRVAGPAGAPRWVRTRTFPVRGERNDVVRVIAVSEDVTERKELEMRIQQSQEREIARLRSEVQKESSPEDLLLGSSEAMRRLRELIRRVAPSNATVLVTGESGTGKELVAKAIHRNGPRAQGPFKDVNSAAFTEGLPESELFGHEKGAFTGAGAQHQGKFEQAHGGTLFLDEIGDMPLPIQAKILRVLEERSFERVGGKEKIRADVRVVCATNRDLDQAIEKETFRHDLRFRFNVEIRIPPLRERASDIPELARHFLARANREEKRQVEISDVAMELLKAHSWPGNVRELKHAIEQAVLFCQADTILPEDLPPAIAGKRPAPAPARGKVRINDAVQDLERRLIVEALRESRGVKTEAARGLGTNERNLTYKMNKLGVAALAESPWVKTL